MGGAGNDHDDDNDSDAPAVDVPSLLQGVGPQRYQLSLSHSLARRLLGLLDHRAEKGRLLLL